MHVHTRNGSKLVPIEISFLVLLSGPLRQGRIEGVLVQVRSLQIDVWILNFVPL